LPDFQPREGSGLFDLQRTSAAGCASRSAPMSAAARFRPAALLDEAYKVAQLRHHSLSALSAFYLATLGAPAARSR